MPCGRQVSTQLAPEQVAVDSGGGVPQLVPLATVLHVLVLAADWQLWQALLGFSVPDDTTLPPMSQSATQLPATQMLVPPLHGVPVARLLQP